MDPSMPPPPQEYGASAGALVVSEQQVNPYAQPPQPPNPYGNPYGQQMQPYGGYAPPPPPPPPVDPFSVFESAPAPAFETAMVPAAPSALAVTSAAPAVSDDEFWSSLGPATAEEAPPAVQEKEVDQVEEEKKGEEGLPPGGEWYDARIFTPTLGVMFFKPQELTDSLFLNTDKSVVDALGERPVVAFIVEGSSARSAGVELGHVLLKVNGIDVKNPKEASRLIKEGPRPLPLLFYVPTTDVVVAEGEHMVKYDTKETTAPNSAKDWKPKYVVIGGIISQPWMMNMYRSKVSG
jgi:membrane-associated protease RseP (regulator of RpoE activity)